MENYPFWFVYSLAKQCAAKVCVLLLQLGTPHCGKAIHYARLITLLNRSQLMALHILITAAPTVDLPNPGGFPLTISSLTLQAFKETLPLASPLSEQVSF